MPNADPLRLLSQAVGVSAPYRWQVAAFNRFVAGDIPGQVVVPTAAGKTMILPIFVAALAAQALSGRVSLPRRLVHVVNRRILVDESTRLAAAIGEALRSQPGLAPMQAALSGLSASGTALAVAALRGGIDDSGDWSQDPSTPCIVLATPDMLGSRLLFRGYGIGRSRGATHAGLLGCDCLVVHDEAHLAPAFTALLRQVESAAMPGSQAIGRPPLRVIEMTATLAQASNVRPLVCDVSEDAALAARMSAVKHLQILDVRRDAGGAGKPASLVMDALASSALAERDSASAVAVFVSSPAVADGLAGRLLKGGVPSEQVLVLTGTMRGHERAALAGGPTFSRFDTGAGRTQGTTAYFIATAAGEIGLDIDADVGLFDLTTLDRLIQRAGRVNRRGSGVGTIKVFHAGGDELPEALRTRALAGLSMLHGSTGPDATIDASPFALSRLCHLPGYVDAIEPAPPVRRLEPAIIEMLSMTSFSLDEIRCPAPEVFIRGLVDEDAELHIAWRVLPRPGSDLAAWLEAWPVIRTETVRLPIDTARRLLLARLRPVQDEPPQLLAITLDAQGSLMAHVPALASGDRPDRWVYRLRPGSLIVLDAALGGLDPHGIPAADAAAPVPDVSCGFVDAGGLARTEIRHVDVTAQAGSDGLEWATGEHRAASLTELLEQVAGGLEIAYRDAPPEIGLNGGSGTLTLWLSRPAPRPPDAGDRASIIGRDRLLQDHLDLAGRAARRLCRALGLASEVGSAVIRAAIAHDRGKAWERWQRAIGNRDSARPLGKSARTTFDSRMNDGYRHELGSIVDDGATLTLLERHLVASHHGWSRPGFTARALAKPGCAAAGTSCAVGFAELSHTLGPWALAYLEAVLKSADILAEVLAEPLAQDAAQSLPAPTRFPTMPRVAAERFTLAIDLTNFGEYLAGLGLVSWLDAAGRNLRVGWDETRLVLEGVSAAAVHEVLAGVRGARVERDLQATAAEQRDAAYPPLRLALDGLGFEMNHWLDEHLRAGSRWKLGAGQTTAFATLERVVRACAASLDLHDFAPEGILSIGGGRVGADASKFRFDAATNWSARDAGFSLNESDAFKSTRPWVELLAALGLQRYFVPPGDDEAAYYAWSDMLPVPLTLAASKGLLPQSRGGLVPVLKASGKMKDVFPSQPVHRERNPSWPARVLVI